MKPPFPERTAMATESPFTLAKARSSAISLVNWGATNVRVIESFSRGGAEAPYIAYDNRCGVARIARNNTDIIEARESFA